MDTRQLEDRLELGGHMDTASKTPRQVEDRLELEERARRLAAAGRRLLGITGAPGAGKL
jgi:putative protein kinase ArgK-like GTPase of G3E family